VIALVCLLAGELINPMKDLSPVWASLSGYVAFQNHFTAFPLLHWMIYPVTGYLFGKILLHVADKKAFYLRLLMSSLTLFVLLSVILVIFHYRLTSIFIGEMYYKQDIIKFAWIILLCFAEISIFFFVLSALHWESLNVLIGYISKKLNPIYVVHWILIGWCWVIFLPEIPVFGYAFFLLFAGITAGSVLIVWLKDRFHSQ